LHQTGDIALIQGTVPAAIEAYRRSNDFEDSPATRVDLAQAYFQAQSFDKSLSIVTDVLVANPNNAHAWYVQGKVWMVKARYDEAVKSFRRALSLQADPAASYLLRVALPQAGETGVGARASSSLDSVLRHAMHLRSSFEPAMVTVQERVRMKRLQLEVRTVLANTLNDLGTAEAQQERYSLALAHFHEAASFSADVPGLLRNTGIAAARAEDYPECIRALRPVVAENPQDNTARAMLGTALFATRSYADAAQVFKPLGDSALQLHELAYSWAASLVYTNKYSEASVLLSKMEQQALSTQTLLLVAQLWSQMGNYEKTVAVCHRALELDSKLTRAHYFAGLALLRLERPEEAARELQGELQLDPDNIDAEFNLAFTLLQQSQNQQAVELWKKVLARNPDHAEANYELGKELLAEGKSPEALPYLEASVRLKPQFEPAHYQLQSAYRAVGRKDDADREAKIYRALKAKSRNITLPPPRQPDSSSN
jgi:tetratricopeptide (TPR) repeat protein